MTNSVKALAVILYLALCVGVGYFCYWLCGG
jgi:hypothetical protein